MSNYTVTTNFSAKDGLTTGNPSKLVLGADFQLEFNNIATMSATKADLASPTFSGTVTFSGDLAVGDNVSVNIGDDSDLAIYHDGSHSYIEETGTGALYIKGNSDIQLQDSAGEKWINCDSGVGRVRLFHIDTGVSTQRLATSANGVNITGECNATSVSLGNWSIELDGSNTLQFKWSGVSKASLTTAGKFTTSDDVEAFGTP